MTASDGLTVIGETNALSMGLDGPASPVPVLKSPAGAVMQGDRSESAGCRSRTAATAAIALAKEVDELSSMLLRPASEWLPVVPANGWSRTLARNPTVEPSTGRPPASSASVAGF